MKFEKFLKGCGTHGKTITLPNEDKWLVCGNVGMKIPNGVQTLLGMNTEEADEYFRQIVNADLEIDQLWLHQAVLLDPAGGSKDILRIFKTEYNDTIGIHNADYGLLEKHDTLTLLEIEIDDSENPRTDRFVIVSKYGDIVGFIKE